MLIIEKKWIVLVLAVSAGCLLALATALFGENKPREPGYGSSVWEVPGWRPSKPGQNSGKLPPEPGGQGRSTGVGTDGASGEVGLQPAPGDLPEVGGDSGRNWPEQAGTIPVLCYHEIGAPGDHPFTVSTADFRRQLSFLREAGYTSIGLDDLYYHLNGEGGELPARPIILSFDGGTRTQGGIVAAVLEQYDYTGVLFVDPAAASSIDERFMDWDKIKALVRGGRFEIGSHGLRRGPVPRQSSREIERRLEKSRRILRKELGIEIHDLSYPSGLYDRRILSAARRHGFRMAFTVNMGRSEPGMELLALPRITITPDVDINRFAAYLKLHTPGKFRPTPADGSYVRSAQALEVDLPGVDPEGLQLKLAGRIVSGGLRAGTFRGRLPAFDGRRDFLPLTLRGRLQNGRPFFRQYLYLRKR